MPTHRRSSEARSIFVASEVAIDGTLQVPSSSLHAAFMPVGDRSSYEDKFRNFLRISPCVDWGSVESRRERNPQGTTPHRVPQPRPLYLDPSHGAGPFMASSFVSPTIESIKDSLTTDRLNMWTR